ncbi:MAG: Hpt domain-containing protein [Spirochaetes bacterium]|jgi:HPt (histidine-containing phosphotransfer) domain-containing protein|nr:Hpt domain-containing protein [Spirochaetota bacterium]
MPEILNIEATMQRIDHDKERLKELYAIALEELPKWKNRLTSAIDAGDKNAIKKSAHSYKGSSATLGAEVLFEMFLSIEKLAEKDDITGVQNLFKNDYEENVNNLKIAINEFIS